MLHFCFLLNISLSRVGKEREKEKLANWVQLANGSLPRVKKVAVNGSKW